MLYSYMDKGVIYVPVKLRIHVFVKKRFYESSKRRSFYFRRYIKLKCRTAFIKAYAEARSFVKRAYDKAPSNPEISEHYTIVSTETHGPGGKEKASSQGGKK